MEKQEVVIRIKVKGYKKSLKKLENFLKLIEQINEALEKLNSIGKEEPTLFVLENNGYDSTEKFWNKVKESRPFNIVKSPCEPTIKMSDNLSSTVQKMAESITKIINETKENEPTD